MSIEAQIWKRYGSKVNTEAMCKFGRTRYSINVFTKVKELKCTNVHGKHIRKDQYGKKERGRVIDHVCLV
ncbi:hypothetical protein HanXRQr2_Chr14g0629861 [Helianthus annuus]|nr:hypothetical protein HanXRQr2_Chr14g0629861 [Helianthus annuus]KAJ0658952.1 hypothetical protein HanOQP8_Chr14g0520501 [Helianthus annuus]